MKIFATRDTHRGILVTVPGPVDDRLTFTITKLSDGLWRAHCHATPWLTINWDDSDVKTQFRLVYGAIRGEVKARRKARKARRA